MDSYAPPFQGGDSGVDEQVKTDTRLVVNICLAHPEDWCFSGYLDFSELQYLERRITKLLNEFGGDSRDYNTRNNLRHLIDGVEEKIRG